MRKAFTLIEVLVLVTTVPFVMVAISGVFTIFIRDIPRTTGMLQYNTTVLNMLGQLRRDMDEATGLPTQFDGQHAGERTLLIEHPDQVVSYEVKPKQIVRTVHNETEATGTQVRVWRIGDAVVTWHLWSNQDEAYAVEIHSYQQQRVAAQLTKKLANTHVFFIGGLGKDHVSR